MSDSYHEARSYDVSKGSAYAVIQTKRWVKTPDV